MFDLSRLAASAWGLVGSGSASDALSGSQLGDLLAGAGIDIASLQGLAPQEMLDLLSQHGIDVANLAPEGVQQLLGALGSEGGASELLGGIVSAIRNR